jgi:hypothetical protein
MVPLLTIVLLLSVFVAGNSPNDNDLKNVGFVVMSQSHKRHELIAEETKRKLIEDLKIQKVEHPTVLDLPRHGAWTYFPLFSGNLGLVKLG